MNINIYSIVIPIATSNGQNNDCKLVFTRQKWEAFNQVHSMRFIAFFHSFIIYRSIYWFYLMLLLFWTHLAEFRNIQKQNWMIYSHKMCVDRFNEFPFTIYHEKYIFKLNLSEWTHYDSVNWCKKFIKIKLLRFKWNKTNFMARLKFRCF